MPSAWRAEVIRRVSRAVRANYLAAQEDLAEGEATGEPLTDQQARQIATEVVDRLTAAGTGAYPLIVDRRGLKFILEERSYYAGHRHDVLHVLVWDDDEQRWMSAEEISLERPP